MYQTLREFIDCLIKESNNNLDIPIVKVTKFENPDEIHISSKIHISKITDTDNITVLVI